MLTFTQLSHNAPINRGGRRTDSVAFCFLDTDLRKDYSNEAHFSAEQPGSRASSWFPFADVDGCWPQHPERAPCTRSQEAVGLIDQEKADMARYSVIRKRADFLAANRGRRYATPGFVLLVQDRPKIQGRDDDHAIRLGITITKKVGNAVIRNRMRRRFRELARELLDAHGKPGADHILIGRNDGIERDFGELRADMLRALTKLAEKNRSAEPVEVRPADTRPSTGSGLR
jgi:ribonuclease P protein component